MAKYTRKCTRCDGTGEYPVPGGRSGECWGCTNSEGPVGHVVVRTGKDKAQYDENMVFVKEFLPTLRNRAMEMAPSRSMAGSYASQAKEGLWKLAQTEPERVTKLRASVAAGRTDDVIRSLVTY